MKLLVFAFRNTAAERVARKLELPADTIYLDSSVEAIEQFVSSTDFLRYTHILGLGAYSGRDQDKLRIETVCTSQFRNSKDNLQTLAIPYFLQPNEHMKLAKGMGNSWCNYVSHQLLSATSHAHYTFLHIPKSYEITSAGYAIRAQLLSI
jgi:hypothetical protein